MLQTLIVVVGIALADSVNPSTVGPGVFLAMSERPSRRVLEFAAGGFLVNFAAGALLVLGPGRWIVSGIPTPGAHAKHLIELGGGAALCAGAIAVWLLRARLAERDLPGARTGSRTAFAAGATLMLVELPTAVPYFAAIAAIVALDPADPEALLLVAVFNLIFLAPLFAIAVLVHFSTRVRGRLQPVARWLGSHWPHVFASLLALVGMALVAIGVNGLVRA